MTHESLLLFTGTTLSLTVQHIPRHIPIFRSTDGVLDMMTYHLGACNAHYDSGRTMDGCEVLYILHYCSNIYKPEFGIA